MDGLGDTFGSLSMSAPEWKPSSAAASPATTKSAAENVQSEPAGTLSEWSPDASDLNAASVKEFIPGKGWTATTTQTGASTAAVAATATKTVATAANAVSPRTQSRREQASPGSIHRQYGTMELTKQGTYSDVTSGANQTAASKDYAGVEATIAAGPTPAPPPFRSLHGMGLSDDLWRYYRAQTIENLRQMDPEDPRHKAVPPPYCNAFCLDDLSIGKAGHSRRRSFGYPSTTFQVTSREDGYMYCLRRFENVKSATPSVCAAFLDKWLKLGDHPNLVQLHRCFIAQRALFFVYDYVPGSISLKERWNGPMPEDFLWSAISQFVSLLRRVHGAKLAVRIMDMSHVLTKTDPSQSRIHVYVNCAGIIDVIECETHKSVSDLQHQDIRNLGRLILSMATGTDITSQTDNATLSRCEQFCISHYSRELHNLCFTLIRSRIPPSIADIGRVLADRLLDELDACSTVLDRTESALANEYESGRISRLLLKMGFVNERPEFGPNRRWAQSGDCYILSLFRDYGECIALHA